MNREIKEKWVAALRSGEYKQGMGQLRDSSDSRFCCLGVLTDLYIKETGQGKWDSNFFRSGNKDGNLFSGFTPEPVRVWAGLRDRNPQVDATNLATLNDGGCTFNQIADKIEEYL